MKGCCYNLCLRWKNEVTGSVTSTRPDFPDGYCCFVGCRILYTNQSVTVHDLTDIIGYDDETLEWNFQINRVCFLGDSHIAPDPDNIDGCDVVFNAYEDADGLIQWLDLCNRKIHSPYTRIILS